MTAKIVSYMKLKMHSKKVTNFLIMRSKLGDAHGNKILITSCEFAAVLIHGNVIDATNHSF